MSKLGDHIRQQVNDIRIDPQRPLILCDADEVLFQFIRGLEGHLEDSGYHLDLQSFALSGNIKRTENGETASRDEVSSLLKSFFADRVEDLLAVPGAVKALNTLAQDAQVVVLTNTPVAQRSGREAALRKNNMAFPVIANEGAKGAAAAALTQDHHAPVVFIDDLPHNIESVVQAVDRATGVHFVADPRLRPMIPKAPAALHRVDEWPEAEPLIRDLIKGA